MGSNPGLAALAQRVCAREARPIAAVVVNLPPRVFPHAEHLQERTQMPLPTTSATARAIMALIKQREADNPRIESFGERHARRHKEILELMNERETDKRFAWVCDDPNSGVYERRVVADRWYGSLADFEEAESLYGSVETVA